MTRAFPKHAYRLGRFLKSCSFQEIKDPSKQAVSRNLKLVRSEKDVPVVLAARKARIRYLVTNDKDLTVKDKTTKTFRQWFTPILSAVFLKEAMSWTSEGLEAIRHRTWGDLEDKVFVIFHFTVGECSCTRSRSIIAARRPLLQFEAILFEQ